MQIISKKIVRIIINLVCFFSLSFLFLSNYTFAEKIEDIFVDISSSYEYYDELELLYERGMIFPDSQGKFNANKYLNRDEFVGISMEVTCRKCISPETDALYINKYAGKETFYDVPTSNKYFYCISESDTKSYVAGYDFGYQCDSGRQSDNERPFCVDNKITLEEALAVLLRNSGLFSVEDNKKVIDDIYNGRISKDLADDVSPRNADGSVYTFYGYFRKALELELIEYSSSGDEKIYRLLDQSKTRFNPGKSITKQDFLKMAYVILKSNSCKANSDYILPVSIEVFPQSCSQSNTTCDILDANGDDTIYDFGGNSFSTCEDGIDNEKGYTWKFYNDLSGKEYIKTGSYIDNHSFLSPGKWSVYLYVTDECGDTGRAMSSVYIKSSDLDSKITSNEIFVHIKGGPLIQTVGGTLSFEGIAEGGNKDYTYTWDYGDLKKSTGSKSIHVYNQTGVFSIRLTVTDSDGNTGTAMNTVTIISENGDDDSGLGVEIGVNQLTQTVGKAFDFRSIVEGGNQKYEYLWDFGDDKTSKNKDVVHVFKKPGVYDVILSVQDSQGNNGKSNVQIVVLDNTNGENNTDGLGVSISSKPLIQEIGKEINFSSLVRGGNGNYTYSWDYGDGDTSTGKNVRHSFEEEGTYIVKLFITDSSGKTGTANVSVVINNDDNGTDDRLGVSITGGPLVQEIGKNIVLVGEVDGGDGTYTFDWEMGDGTQRDNEKIIQTYTVPGEYEVILNVTDKDGKKATSTATIVITESKDNNNSTNNNTESLGVRIGVSPIVQIAGGDIDFSGVVTGGNGDYTYSWDLGDGGYSTDKNIDYSYVIPGNYLVDLIVTDSDGKTGTASVEIVITERNQDDRLGVSITGGPLVQEIGEPIIFTGEVEGGDGNYTFDWKMGDGSKGGSKRVVSRYSRIGEYEVELEVVDGTGKKGVSTVTVVVKDSSVDTGIWVPGIPETTPGVNSGYAGLGVRISATPLVQGIGEEIDFSGIVSGGNGDYTYSWDFGDGGISSGEKINYSYDDIGGYLVELIVTDSEGNRGVGTVEILIRADDDNNNGTTTTESDRLGVSITGGPLVQKIGEDILLTGEVDGGDGNYEYSWTTGDGTKLTGKRIIKSYNGLGTYEIALNVVDGGGKKGVAYTTVVITDNDNGDTEDTSGQDGLGVNIGVDPVVQRVGGTINFESLISGGSGDYDYKWNFGNGSLSTEEDIEYVYDKSGSYIVVLDVVDSAGNSGTARVEVIIEKGDVEINDDDELVSDNGGLGVSIQGIVTRVDLGGPIKLKGNVAGGDGNYTYIWDYSDGTVGNGEHINHIYNKKGSYLVKLIVTDGEGRTGSSQINVGVGVGDISGLSVFIETDTDFGTQNVNIDFTGVTYPQGDYTYEWDFGDGNIGFGKEPSHVYPTTGLYTVILNVSDDNGNTGDAEATIRVFSVNSCEIDSDLDGVVDCRDSCPLVSGSSLNGGCPILDTFCNSDCSCGDGYSCSSNDQAVCSISGVCEPVITSLNPCLELGHSTFIYGNTTCNSCPCSYSLDFNSILRKCDVIFPAITSVDSKTVFSRGEVYTISE